MCYYIFEVCKQISKAWGSEKERKVKVCAVGGLDREAGVDWGKAGREMGTYDTWCCLRSGATGSNISKSNWDAHWRTGLRWWSKTCLAVNSLCLKCSKHNSACVSWLTSPISWMSQFKKQLAANIFWPLNNIQGTCLSIFACICSILTNTFSYNFHHLTNNIYWVLPTTSPAIS